MSECLRHSFSCVAHMHVVLKFELLLAVALWRHGILQVSASDSPELRLLRPLVLEAAGFLGYTHAMNTAGGEANGFFDFEASHASAVM